MSGRRREFPLSRFGGIIKLFVSLTALFGAFFLGIMVGRSDIKGFPGLEKEVKSDVVKMKIDSAPMEQPPVLPTSNPEKTVLTDNITSKPVMTFYDTLAKPDKSRKKTESSSSMKDEAPGKIYTVQTGAMKDRSLADSAVLKLKKKGYSAYISSSESSGKVTWYRVRLGTFSNREEASKEAQRIERNEGISATVVEK